MLNWEHSVNGCIFSYGDGRYYECEPSTYEGAPDKSWELYISGYKLTSVAINKIILRGESLQNCLCAAEKYESWECGLPIPEVK